MRGMNRVLLLESKLTLIFLVLGCDDSCDVRAIQDCLFIYLAFILSYDYNYLYSMYQITIYLIHHYNFAQSLPPQHSFAYRKRQIRYQLKTGSDRMPFPYSQAPSNLAVSYISLIFLKDTTPNMLDATSRTSDIRLWETPR